MLDQATKQLTFRLPESLIERVESCVASIQKQSGLTVTRADVVRMLLTRALDETGCNLKRLFTPPARRRKGDPK
jgi:hypothetical protein